MNKKDSNYYYERVREVFTPQGVFATEWARLRVKRVVRLVGEIKKNANVLDLGCGFGVLTSIFSRNTSVYGGDVSEDSLEIAKFVVEKYGRKERVELLYFDVQFLPFRHKVFDTVIAIDLVEHLSSRQYLNCLNEIRRVSKNGTIFVIYTPNPINLVSSSFYLRRKGPYTPEHTGLKSPFFLRRTLLKAGFSIEKFFCLEIGESYIEKFLNHHVPFLLGKILKKNWVFSFLRGGRMCIRAKIM